MENQSDLVSDLADVRTSLLNDVFLKIQKLAWDKIYRENIAPEKLVFFCVDTLSSWRALAEQLKSEEATLAMQTPKVVTLIWGYSDESFYEFLSCVNLDDTDIRFIQDITPTPGKVKYLIFDDCGVDIREVIPKNPSGLQ